MKRSNFLKISLTTGILGWAFGFSALAKVNEKRKVGHLIAEEEFLYTNGYIKSRVRIDGKLTDEHMFGIAVAVTLPILIPVVGKEELQQEEMRVLRVAYINNRELNPQLGNFIGYKGNKEEVYGKLLLNCKDFLKKKLNSFVVSCEFKTFTRETIQLDENRLNEITINSRTKEGIKIHKEIWKNSPLSLFPFNEEHLRV
jgi:hypothetical protein